MKASICLTIVGLAPCFALAQPLIPSDILLSEKGSFDPKYTSIRLPLTHDNRGFFGADVDAFNSGDYFKVWKDIEIIGTPASSDPDDRPTLTFDSRTEFFGPSGQRRDIITEKVSLTDVQFNAGDVRFFFQGDNNLIEVNNSDMHFRGVSIPTVFVTKPLTLRFTGGDSEIVNMTNNYSGTTAIEVQTGANATFSFSGNPDSSSFSDAFRLYGPSTVSVDGGTLTFKDSYFIQRDGTTTVENNGRLYAHGGGTKVDIDRLTLQTGGTAEVGLGGAVVSVTDTLEMHSGIAQFHDSARLNVETLELSGSSIFESAEAGQTRGRVAIEVLKTDGSGPTDLSLTHLDLMSTELLFGDSDLTINLDHSGLRVSGDNNISFFYLRGATINVGDRSSLAIFGRQASSEIFGTINVASGGKFTVGELFDLYLKPTLDVDMQSGATMTVYGSLSGAGDIGEGDLYVYADTRRTGVIAPGDTSSLAASERIGTITTDGYVQISGGLTPPGFDDALISTGLFDGGIYEADLSVAGGTPQNDLLAYGDGDVRLSMMDHIRVTTLDSPTASDLHGQSFTVIAAQDGTKTGTILLQNQTIDITEDGSVPALVDFVVSDENTNGRPDVTLTAQSQALTALKSHKVLTGNANTQKAVAGLVATGSTAGGTQLTSGTTVTTALNTITNAQLAQLDAAHAEPFSSNMTVGLEQMDLVQDIVRRHSTDDGLAQTNLSNDAVARAFMAPPPVGASSTAPATRRTVSEFTPQRRGWVDAAAVSGQVDGRNNLGGFKYTLNGLVGGLDILRDADRKAGIFAGYGTTSMDEHDSIDQSLDGHLFHLGGYAQLKLPSGWEITGIGGLMTGDMKSTRIAPDVGALSGGTARASFDTRGAYVAAFGARAIPVSAATLMRPSLGVSYSYLHQDSFRETGANDLNFDVGSANARSFVVSAGLDAEHQLNSQVADITALGLVRYHYDFMADENEAHAISVSNPIFGTFTQVGQNRGPQGLTFGIGAKGQVTDNATFGFGYAYSWNSNGVEHGLGGSLNFTW
jgi:uncharacterized protein with beta-barrel porin domain